jgi:hypothetical protein
MGRWKDASDKVDKIVKEEVTDKRDAGSSGRN